MVIAFHRKRLDVGAHHRLWLIIAGMIAFLLAVLWA